MAGLALGLAAATAAAQFATNPGQWYIDRQMYSMRAFNATVGTSMLPSMTGVKPPPGAASAAEPARDVTRFATAAAPRMPAQLAAREGGDAAVKREAEARYLRHLDTYRATARKDGFPADDLAYAYQYFVVNHYQIHHDLVDVPLEQDPRLRQARDGFARIEAAAQKRQLQVSPLQERAVYQQFRAQLAASPEVRRMNDVQKQEAAELLAISLGVVFEGYTAGLARGDDALAQRSREAARGALEKLLGRPIARIRIDERGIVE